MYGNMTREEMIQRLYEGNFTTGELERQLIAKLFEQCCGGGSGSSGGGVFVVHAIIDIEANSCTLDKTAVEISEAFKTMPVIVVGNVVSESDNIWSQHYITQVTIKEDGVDDRYTFRDDTGATYYAINDNDYPATKR